MATELTWQYQYGAAGEGLRLNETSSVAAIRAKYLWDLCRFLTGADGKGTLGLWTVAGSGDSTAGGMDGVDRWALTGSFDAAKIRYTSTDAYSWIILRAPVTLHANLWFILSTTATANQAAFGYSHTFPEWQHGAVFASRTSGATGSNTCIACDGDANVVAAGSGGVVVTSADAGATWTTRANAGGALLALSKDGARVVGVTTGGSQYSVNHGANWLVGTGQGTPAWIAVTLLGLNAVAVASTVGTGAIVSSDGGVNWSPTVIPSGSYRAITRNGTNICAVGAGICALSTDNGATWVAGGTLLGTYVASARDGNNIVAVGTNCVSTSTDGGATWTLGAIPAGTYTSCARIGNLVVAGGANLCATSTDGGLTWTVRTCTITLQGLTATSKGFCAAATAQQTGISWADWSGQTLPGKYVPQTNFTVCHAVTLHSLTMHGWLSTRGDFYIALGRVGDGRWAHGFAIGKLQDAPASDEYPISMHVTGDPAQTTVTQATEGFSSAGSAGIGISALLNGRAYSASKGVMYACIPIAYALNTGSNYYIVFSETGPTPTMALPAVVVAATTTGFVSPEWRGRLPDAKVGKTYTLDLAPSVGAVEWINVGSLWLPWVNGVTPSV